MPPVQHNPLACGTAVPAWRRSTAHLGLLAGLIALSTVAACGGGSAAHTQTGEGALPSASTSSSPTAALTARQRAVAAATAQVNRYEQVLDELGIHPTLSLDRLYTVATEPEVLDEIAYYNHFRSAHDRQAGHVKLTATRVDRVDLTNRPHTHPPVYPTVKITTCVNVSGVRAFDAQGRSIVARSRKPYFLTHLTLVNLKYPATTGWVVKKVADTEERTCGA
jgi:hypothetical protein